MFYLYELKLRLFQSQNKEKTSSLSSAFDKSFRRITINRICQIYNILRSSSYVSFYTGSQERDENHCEVIDVPGDENFCMYVACTSMYFRGHKASFLDPISRQKMSGLFYSILFKST